MGKTSTLRGNVIFKEFAPSESLTNRILSIASDGTITDRPAIAASGFVSSTLPSAQIIVGNGSNVATAVSMSGDVTISNAGVTAIGAGVIVNADVNASAGIVYSKLNLTGGIVNADVNASAAIAYSKLNLATSIVNADVAVAAGIARSKTASGTAYRILANTSAGVMSENAALTAARAIVSDANGQLVAATPTTTEINRVAGVTSAIQTQLSTLITGKATNALVQSPGAGQDGFAITWDNGAAEYTLTDPVVQGIPVAGSTRQFLGKNSGTNYDASWLTLLITDMPAITASAADINVMQGANAASVTPTIISYLGGATPLSSSVQNQLNTKQGSSLAQNAIWVGNGSGVATALSGGTNGYVLTSVSGAPTWQPATGGIAGLTVNRIPYASGATTLVDDSGLTWDATNNAITVGSVRMHGTGTTSVYVGELSGNFTTTAISNVAVGYASLLDVTDGGGNVGIGYGAINNITGGDNNVGVGVNTLGTITTQNNNVAVGYQSLVNTTGSNNIALGYQAGDGLGSGSNNIIIGYDTDAQGATSSNQLTLQNAIFGLGNSGSGTTVSSGIIGLYSVGAIGSWQKATFIGNIAAEGTAVANSIVLYAKDSSDGATNSTLSLYTEQVPEATATFTQTHRVKIWWNGVEYWLSLDAV